MQPYPKVRALKSLLCANGAATELTRSAGTGFFRLTTDHATATLYLGTANTVTTPTGAGAATDGAALPPRVPKDFHLVPQQSLWVRNDSGGDVFLSVEEF